MHTKDVCRDTKGIAPRIFNISIKQDEFQATDTHHWTRTARLLLNLVLFGTVWMVSQRDRSHQHIVFFCFHPIALRIVFFCFLSIT